mmetsp:Transcript_16634/g.42993  ORF Transcript_16634/g.42993 Transcript_16634/m.42993 type:complete len:296 (-) Transcript_16634:1024-1911(-)
MGPSPVTANSCESALPTAWRSRVAALGDGALRVVLHVDVRVVLQLDECRFDGPIDALGPEAVVLHHPHGRAAGAEAHVGHAVLGRLDKQRHDVLDDLVRRHDTRNLRQNMQGGDAVCVASALRVLLHQLREEVLHGPLRAEGVGDLFQVLDGGLPHGVHGVPQARQEQRLQLRLEHLHAEEASELGHLLDDALPDAPVVVHDQVLDGVQQGVHEAIHRQHLADETRMRDDVQAHVVELVLHQVRDQAQQLALRHIAAEHFGNRAQDLGQGSSDGLRGVEAQGLELRQDVLLQLLR